MDFSTLLNDCNIPTEASKIYKDECIYSFDGPESVDGIFISLRSFLGVGKRHLQFFCQKYGHRLFLNHQRIRYYKDNSEVVDSDASPAAKKPTRLAIGTEDGFAGTESQFTFKEVNRLVVMPEEFIVDLPSTDLPEKISACIAGVLAAESAWKLEELAAMSNTWDGELLLESKYARDLKQLNNGVKISPSGWKCANCDLKENLWLNLTDGSILCGRRFFDGTGGNNHALDSFQVTGFPLAVKLGTITSTSADVFSYPEDSMVLDPFLAQHLSHFGIDIQKLTKTDKTINELEIDLNMKVQEWDVIQESDARLEAAFGPGFTGIRNLGNSCYMNSVLQVLFGIPNFIKTYQQVSTFAENSGNPVEDFNLQFAKIAHGLLSGDYSFQTNPPSNNEVVLPQGIRPYMFKHLMGKGHQEFSTKRQQDAFEFLLHLFSLMEKSSRGSINASEVCSFQVADRVQCLASQKVMINKRKEFALSLPIPLDKMINRAEYEDYESTKSESTNTTVVRPIVPLQACLEAFAATEVIEDFFSTAVNAKTQACKSLSIVTFPEVLILHARKFVVDESWCPNKLHVALEVPDVLDLSFMKFAGLKPGEEEMPSASDEKLKQPSVDRGMVEQVMAMGFSENGSTRAVLNTSGQGLEAAINWVMDHMSDYDFDSPISAPPSAADAQADFEPNPDGLATVMSMGFTRDQAILSLRKCNNQVERAIDWIFSHQDELSCGDNSSTEAAKELAFTDGAPNYRLFALISHMGQSSQTGHYVCHIRKGDSWYIFNDEKVAKSEKPPKELAYLYFYSRC